MYFLIISMTFGEDHYVFKIKFNDQAKQIKPTFYERNNETVRARQSNAEPASKSTSPGG